MSAVLFALLAALGNAIASVLQRRANRSAPEQTGVSVSYVWALIRRPVWLGGVGSLIAAFLLQAAALSQGGLALVQPLLIAELPLTMVIVAWTSDSGLGRRAWVAVGALTAGIAVFLVAAAPRKGHTTPGMLTWIVAVAATIALIGALLFLGRRLSGPSRAAMLGVAVGIGFAFTATFMKATTNLVSQGLAVLLTSWEPYAMAATGMSTFLLLQKALQSGTLVAAQPALTLSDPIAAILYGVGLFGEEIRSGVVVIVEILGIGMILYGSVHLARSQPIQEESPD